MFNYKKAVEVVLEKWGQGLELPGSSLGGAYTMMYFSKPTKLDAKKVDFIVY